MLIAIHSFAGVFIAYAVFIFVTASINILWMGILVEDLRLRLEEKEQHKSSADTE